MHKFTIFSFLALLFTQLCCAQTQIIPLNFDVSGYADPTPVLQRSSVSPLDTIPAIKAEMNVNQMGALTYTLPIEVLKGVNNFQPNLSLSYSSQSGNGQAGWGWNIVGLSMITQGGKSKHLDGITQGPQFNTEDPFYLDGQRLLQTTPSVFETEKYSKIKISKQTSEAEFSFIVQYTDGKIAKYKELTTGQHYIAVLIDALNHEIHYSYTLTNSIPLISTISYGGNTVATDLFFVRYIYSNRAVPLKSYRNGIEYKSTQILSELRITSSYLTQNNGLYRKYKLSYDKIQNNTVERLVKVEVENEKGIPLKPLVFGYNNNATSATVQKEGSWIAKLPYNTIGLGNTVVGDFFGTGVPYPMYEIKESNTVFKLYNPKTGIIDTYNKSRKYFAGRVIRGQKIAEIDELIYAAVAYNGTSTTPDNTAELVDRLTFKAKNFTSYYTNTITMDLPGGLVEQQVQNDPYDYTQPNQASYYRDLSEREIISGDFNNDGLVDVFIIEKANLTRPQQVYFVEIGKTQSGHIIPTPVTVSGLLADSDFYPMEFDGDGIPELLMVNRSDSNSTYSLYKFNPTLLTLTAVPNQSSITLAHFTKKTPLIFGDFNGDGLTDFITPQKVYNLENTSATVELQKMETDQLLWWQYTSTGTNFNVEQKDYTQQKLAYIATSQRNVIKRSSGWEKFWSGKPDSYNYTEYGTSTIIATDFNNDGKTDLISFRKFGRAKYDPSEKLVQTKIESLNYFGTIPSIRGNRILFHQTKSLPNGDQTFANLNTVINLEQTDISPLSLILNYSDYNQLNTYQSGILVHDPILEIDYKYTIKSDEFLEGRLTEINNGGPVLQKIEYKTMVEKNNNNKDDVYTTKKMDLDYPYYVHRNIGTNHLVYKLHTQFEDAIITTEYRYQNGIQHLEGKGFLGFQKTLVSDPYQSILENGKYKMKAVFEGHFWKVSTYNPLQENALIIATYGSLNDASVFSRSIQAYTRFDKGNNRYLILPTSETNTDYLTNSTIVKSYQYDTTQDLVLKQVNTSYNSIGSSIEKFTYAPESSEGEHLHSGRITLRELTTLKDGNDFSTKEEQTFNSNGTLQQTKKYGNDTLPIVTDFTYYPFGEIKTQTVSAEGITAVTTQYQYDATNRFPYKVTTPDGLVFTMNIDPLGKTLSEVSPLGHTTTYQYDHWGNAKQTTNYLGKKTTLTKSTTPNEPLGYYAITTKEEGGTEVISIMDVFDRVIKTKVKTLHDQWVVNETVYDIFGKKIKISEPYFEGDAQLWNTIEYDELNRAVKQTSFTGKILTTCYEGFKITVEDGPKKSSKWMDAMGNITKSQDEGGTLFYKYYPNGILKETNYEGIKTIVDIDGWGNKTKLTDPSAGKFTYTYDNLNRIKKEINPKGGYTEYIYDELGRIKSENTISNAEQTDSRKNYSYDSSTQLPTVISGTSNGKSYTYTTYYDDPYHRVTGKKEQTPDFTNETNFSYDHWGRIAMVETRTTLNNPGYTSTSKIRNNYDAQGTLISQTDMETSALIWQLNSINAHGKTTQAKYGNGYSLNTTYNSTTLLLEKIKHFNDAQAVVDVNYTYDIQKGVLLQRDNLVFGKKESYTYDDLNRLLEETTNGVTMQEYTYDKRGRMTSNTAVGNYKYSEQNYKLQNIQFNETGSHLNTSRGFAEVQYNAYKNPTEIFLEGKDRISFEYSILKTRSASYYGSLSTTASERPNRKFYSADKSIEIVKEGDITKIITYLTGDPYSANYMKVEVLTGGALTSTGRFFLHRDHQNTIVAITQADTEGTMVEKRYFDAWGNLKEAQLGASTTVVLPNAMGWVNSLLIDRGYTGHEHLTTVGLIHMNGRIYDPALRRFMSPDNYVQDPHNTQNYNRYGYVWNNPLVFEDPSGELGFVGAVLVAAAISAVTNSISNMISGVPFWYGMGKSTTMGAIAGAISFQIGTLATSYTSSLNQALFQAGMHATTGGFINVMNDASFMSGFASGLVSSLVSSGVSSLQLEGSTLSAVMLTSGGLSGGISSAIAGGDFWDGVRQGLITSGLNHLAHLVLQPKSTFKIYDDDGDYIGKMKVLKYNLTKNGLEIELGFKSTSSKYSDYNWVQTVSTNSHPDLGYGKWIYNDPTGSAKDDNSPFYYTKSEMSGIRNIDGYSLKFYDNPSRNIKSFDLYWRAELSLIGKIRGEYHEITTLKYGFNLSSTGSYNMLPLLSIPYLNTYKWLKK